MATDTESLDDALEIMKRIMTEQIRDSWPVIARKVLDEVIYHEGSAKGKIVGYLWNTGVGSYESGSNVHAVVREGEELRVYSRGVRE